ncbi:unnamed protein product [Urochloa humidicola]
MSDLSAPVQENCRSQRQGKANLLRGDQYFWIIYKFMHNDTCSPITDASCMSIRAHTNFPYCFFNDRTQFMMSEYFTGL